MFFKLQLKHQFTNWSSRLFNHKLVLYISRKTKISLREFNARTRGREDPCLCYAITNCKAIKSACNNNNNTYLAAHLSKINEEPAKSMNLQNHNDMETAKKLKNENKDTDL